PKPRRKHAKYLDTRSGRIRLAMIADNSAASIEAFVRTNVKRAATLLTDGHASYPGLIDYRHDPRIVGKMAGHVVLPWIHRAFSLMKRWGLGTYHGLRRTHVDTYLNEFVFRYNRRFHRHVSFEALLGLAAHHAPASYWAIVQRDNPRKGVQTIRRPPRRRKTATGMRQDGAPSALGGDQNQPITPVQPLPIVEPGTTGLSLLSQMPILDWLGKKSIVNHHRDVPYRLLHCDKNKSVGDPDSGNLLVHGDNLQALKALLPYYAGKIKCIYIDPPYNTGDENWVYNDNVNSPEIQKWL